MSDRLYRTSGDQITDMEARAVKTFLQNSRRGFWQCERNYEEMVEAMRVAMLASPHVLQAVERTCISCGARTTNGVLPCGH